MQYRMAELIDLAAVQSMVEANCRATGMPIGLIDACDESILAGAGWQEICLRYHRQHPETLQRCLESDRIIKSNLKQGQACRYKCRNGMWDVGLPILVSGEHLATLFIGQFFFQDEAPDREFFARQAATFGFARDEYLQALEAVPLFSRQRVEDILEYNSAFAAFLTSLAEKSLALISANRALEESRERLRILFEKASDAIYVAEPNGNLVHVNEEAGRATGYSERELLGMTVTDIDADTTCREELQNFFSGLRVGEPVTVESRHRRKDGSLFPVEVKVALLESPGERHVLGIARDISQWKRNEEELRTSERRYKKAQQIGKVGNWEYTFANRCFWGSEEAKRIFGFSPDSQQFTVEEVERCIPERQRLQQARTAMFERNEPYNLEYEVVPADGSARRIVKSIAERIDDEHGTPLKIVGVVQDITERKQMEARLQQAQKMEAIGNLAGGIAHDFNNILSPIIGYAELLLARGGEEGFARNGIERILHAGRRGSELVRQILAFSRQSERRLINVEVQQVVREALKLIRAIIPRHIEINTDIAEGCGRVLADPTQLHQIVMNLLTNAYQAIERSEGRITLGVREIHLDEQGLQGTLGPGRYVLLSIADDGCGIAPEVIGKIFEPYFTTKEQGKGTGLGLAVAYGIIREHNGDISVSSEVGRGTTFNVYLPVSEETFELPLARSAEELPGGKERVLVVDDEEAIVEFETLILRRLGYQVTSTTSSATALELFLANPEGFDLVLSDMSMPQLTGDELVRRIRMVAPQVPVVICTGFSERIKKDTAVELGVKTFLMKPVGIDELASTIRRTLDERHAG